ncbi:hypothetical protein DICSQDRAFT_173353 [Dichomitus squalens LYAD-421 SS1]|uniref:Uncharacterized protein n=2 Tax=Dichomitus squalens TaxID=114155 RepID=A0A4Q9MQE2_9APHY|nr:uncharacterized protein DICSQDRAFT_173353 [Dichomitus squalens LYAD-421 SS1]EJF57986.1 hypothetical protein DICSQDRAFT_173353 [Dichomitus squalens LYAD-421 SS1]TBU29238.1 hypothetical protein BD311DRAFT_777614 [Dichomitus squalens]
MDDWDMIFEGETRLYQSLFPETENKYPRAFSTIEGATTLTESEVQVLKPVPRDARHVGGDHSQRAVDRPMTRSQAVVGQKIEFSFNRNARPFLRQRGIPMYALLCASAAALHRIVLGARTKVLTNVALRRIRIRFVWPHPAGYEPAAEVYEEWVPVNDTLTRLQLAMLVAQVFNRFVEQQRTSRLSHYEVFEFRLRQDAFYRVWLVRLERVESNLFIADLNYAVSDPDE